MSIGAPLNLVFMLEEESAKHLLEALLPKMLSEFSHLSIACRCIAHQGKGDLQKSIPRKLRAWRQPGTFFIILHDQDNHDCKELKQKLQEICAKQSRHVPLIRIACRELEAWYFGDLGAVEQAFPKFRAGQYRHRKKYRNPDDIVCPSKELQRIVRGFQKGAAAREIPQYMDMENNASKSFNHLIAGVQEMVRQNTQSQQS